MVISCPSLVKQSQACQGAVINSEKRVSLAFQQLLDHIFTPKHAILLILLTHSPLLAKKGAHLTSFGSAPPPEI